MCAGCQERGGAAEPDRGAHADWTDLSMKQEIMAEGPRCKRRKQANPRRKNGKSAHTSTQSRNNSRKLRGGVPARPAGSSRLRVPGTRQNTENFFNGTSRRVFFLGGGTVRGVRWSVCDGADPDSPGPGGGLRRSEEVSGGLSSASKQENRYTERRLARGPVAPRASQSVSTLT